MSTFSFFINFFFQGDYEMVISDYGRAKSLFAETDIKIFKKGVTAVLCEDVLQLTSNSLHKCALVHQTNGFYHKKEHVSAT